MLDRTLLPTDRIAADRLYYSGKHKRHRMNVQALADPFGRQLWASPALPDAVHDVHAAHEHGLADADIRCRADNGYQGAGSTARTPCWRTTGDPFHRPAGSEPIPREDPRLVEQAMATPESWRLIRRLRCSTTRITELVQAVLTLHLTSSDR
ncbi:transposase family protein [Streptomyces wuyuanensis]|uniref:transposase family protein n=1 Tax=Streptomyces wuyuanensis TaxID=1196353 RepID=UPI00341EE838